MAKSLVIKCSLNFKAKSTSLFGFSGVMFMFIIAMTKIIAE